MPHFLESLATAGRLNLHARVLYGRDDHHKAEALVQGVGTRARNGRAHRAAPGRAGSFDKRRAVMIALIDYGISNLRSVQKAFEHLGAQVTLAKRARIR